MIPLVWLAVALATTVGLAQSPPPWVSRTPLPTVALMPAVPLRLPSSRPTATDPVDSNSPALWSLVDGVETLHVFTSIDGYPSHASGPSLRELGPAQPITWDPVPPVGGVWMEAVIADESGTFYGFYHNEISPPACPGSTRMEPRIGAARSEDQGQTWTDLGIVLAAPPGSAACGSPNKYFAGGVGDFSVLLDAAKQYLYIFFSQYVGDASQQGVTVARMVWADRDAPAGRLSVWRDGVWLPTDPEPPARGDESNDEPVVYQLGAPVFPTTDSWHDGTTTDAFWGPSVHWNAYLERYVMLLNRARTVVWDQEGIYVSFAKRLGDPRAWSQPRQLVEGGRWYPQVMGIEAGTGTDKSAGQVARFFMGGRSEALIVFERN